MSIDFHNTRMGQKFFTQDVPELLRILNRIAASLEEQKSSEKKKQFNNKMLDNKKNETYI